MQCHTIRTAIDHEGEVTHIRDLTPRSWGLWFCRSCNNTLRLHWTHDSGGYFEHDLEDADERRLTHCTYRIIARDKPVSAFDVAVNALMERDDVSVTAPSEKDYFCVLCQRKYYGHRCCPECGQYIYSTEMNDLDTLTIPVAFAK
ncbi:putative zinc ribbon protein [Klebsiella aerogenes]|uniref:putative zinc ribbon protein n=1 Tax=Klebsiella aerogenes TaxID=548 RepID=UPI0024492D35|nr:putative zinc ribbon protein [Klebsiella aerogenes]MDH1610859.1 zinc-ribbon domain-containing protein [Klebsiella aerogenes]